jgi:PAS domain S-box-containing protein
MPVLLDAERHALARIVAGNPLPEVLDELLRAVETCSDVAMLASIQILDKAAVRLLHGAAPSLPKAYCEAIHGGEIGPAAGSCGTAAFRGEPVFVSDISKDPLWTKYRDLALKHGLCACWSTPIRASDGRVLGTFAVYYREPRSPTEQDRESIALITRTVAFAIERDESQQLLRKSEERVSHALSAAGDAGTWEWHIPSDRAYCDARLATMLSLDATTTQEGASLSDYLALVHPDDVERVRTAIEYTITTGERYFQEFRWLKGDGRVRWVVSHGECHYDRDGKPLRLAGAAVDVTLRKQVEEGLRKQTRRLETLNHFSRSISSDLDLERIVQTVTDIATELSGAKFGAFFYNVTDDTGERYLLYTLSGAPPEAFAHLGLPRNTALFAPTFSGAGIIRSDDIRTDPRYAKNAPHHGMPKGHLPVVSYLAVPVVSRAGDVHGGLFFGHDRPAAFTKESEEVVKGIAAHAANAITNARLLEAARAEIAKRGRAEQLQRQRAEMALKESEVRLQEALAAGQVMAFEWDLRTGLSHRSQNAAEILGLELSQAVLGSREEFLARVHPGDCERFQAHVDGLSPNNPSYAVNFRYIRPDGREVWLEETARGEFDSSGRCLRLNGLRRNITEMKRAAEQQALLMGELDHRVKNVLACVDAIVQRTSESSCSSADFLAAFKQRIRSMANTHSILSHGRWRGASLSELVSCELAPWVSEENVEADGPEIFFSAEATQAIAMVLHELTTNAAKYGALSTKQGRLCLRWKYRPNGSSPAAVLLEWRESGVSVAAATIPGYGASVIEDLIPYELGGSVDLAFGCDGVCCRIEIPGKWLAGTSSASIDLQSQANNLAAFLPGT